jgi:multiple sugar transport system permease protein
MTQLRHITIPMITPIIFYNLVLNVITVMQAFTIPYILTAYGPFAAGINNTSTLFLNIYLYKTGFSYFNMGYAATIAWAIFIISVGITLLLFTSAPAWVYYESGTF